MRNVLGTVLPLLCLLNAAHARADETAARSRIVAAGLFKNGLAVIKREVTLGKAGTYALDDVPEPVHGTYWIERVAPVESSVEMREVEVPVNELVPGNLQEDLAGKKVTIHFKGDKATPTNGTVAKLKTLKSEIAESRTDPRDGNNPSVQPARFLVVQTANGRSYIETSEIAYVESEGTEEKIMRRMPRLLLTVPETDKADGKVFVNYLTRGLSWPPSYRVDITNPKTLGVEQYAVIKNELADLDGTEIMLISGFPSVQFAQSRPHLPPAPACAVLPRTQSRRLARCRCAEQPHGPAKGCHEQFRIHVGVEHGCHTYWRRRRSALSVDRQAYSRRGRRTVFEGGTRRVGL